MFRPPIQRTPAGDFRLAIGRRERALLRALPAELERQLGEEPDAPELRRLFPPAHAGDEEAEAGYRRLMGDELLEGRRTALRAFAASLDRDVLTEDDLDVWLRALNDLRLVLGTRLDVTEEDLTEPLDPRDPRAGAVSYTHLTLPTIYSV